MVSRSDVVGSGWDRIATPVPGDVHACLQELGVDVIRITGPEIVGRCPMHVERTGAEDKHPSWSCNEESGLFNCFSCGYAGPFVLLVEDILDVDRSEAVAWVRKRGGVEQLDKELGRAKPVYAKDLVDAGDTTKNINEASLALFVDPPIDACKRRNLTVQDARHYGVMWDREQDLWIIPIRDPDTWALMGWQEKNERYLRNRPNGVKKSHTLFGIDVFPGGTAILVESPLDVVRLHSAGVGGGLAAFGVRASEEQMRLLRAVADDVIVALDNDDSGHIQERALCKQYGPRMRMRVLSYEHCPDVKDPGEMTDDEIHVAVEKAYPSFLAR